MARTRARNGHHNGYGYGYGHWHLDRRIPVAFVIYLFVQAAGFGWWASGVQSEIANHRSAIASLQHKSDRIAVIETELKHISKTLEKMVEKVERLETALSRPNGRVR
jgi:hypothetical protein